MKIAILGDVHANLEALQAVLRHADGQGVDAFVCVGDVVGYNANPVRCLELLRERDCCMVRGNHDHYCAMPPGPDSMSDVAAAAIAWTRQQLSEDQVRFLGRLPLHRECEGFSMVHNTLAMTHAWDYVFGVAEAAQHFRRQERAVCFHGHTHVPVVFRKHGRVSLKLFQAIRVGRGTKYFVNVGSVGQPRDGDPRASYGIYDLDARLIRLYRLRYDIAAAQDKIMDAGLPEWLAVRLTFGL